MNTIEKTRNEVLTSISNRHSDMHKHIEDANKIIFSDNDDQHDETMEKLRKISDDLDDLLS